MSVDVGRRLRPRVPLFLVDKHVDHATDAICDRGASPAQRSDAVRDLVERQWGGGAPLPAHRQRALLRLFERLVQFCHDMQYRPEQISTSCAILIETITFACGADLPDPERVVDHFRAMLIRHSVRRSPRSIAVFSLVDVKSLMSFFLDRVFRFLHLYQYVLGRTRHLHLQTERALAPTPTVYPPLSSATLVPADQPNAKSEQEPATNGAASNGTQAAGESQHAPDEQPSTVGGPPPLTDDEINMIMSDPEAKAALQALLDPRLAALQKRLDDQLDAMDRQFQLEADRITSASLAVRDPPAIQQG